MSKPKILIYDIETSLLLFHGFQCGKQIVRHNQLLPGYFSRTHIICIGYKWMHEKTAHVLDWGTCLEHESQMIEKFSEEIRKADIVIGKNSDRFDNKHINTQLLWHNLPGMPDWLKYTDDLEKQMRKYLYLPSYSLDYLSQQLGLGGKTKMSWNDWEDISYLRMTDLGIDSPALDIISGRNYTDACKLGQKALNKMKRYCKKDVADTAALWKYCEKHFDTKFNYATYEQSIVCKQCGSPNITKNGTKIAGQTRYQSYHCTAHGGYAGKRAISKTGIEGKLS